MSPRAYSIDTGGGRFPRVSGDEPLLGRAWAVNLMFSPRERG